MHEASQFLTVSLSVSYKKDKFVFRDFFLEMKEREIIGLVGGSGSGKSTLALAILRLLDSKGARVSGTLNFKGRNLLELREFEMRQIRGREISLVLQSPTSALNPMLRIRTQMKEAWRAHRRDCDGQAAIVEALKSVSLPTEDAFLKRYPSEISVGQGQRVLIAMAILHSPALLIADEPTSSLDPITQLEILELFRDINRRTGTGILLISHDLFAVESICQRIAVLHEGRILECGSLTEMYSAAAHPYTRALLRSSSRVRRATASSQG